MMVDAILIKRNFYLSKWYGTRGLLSETPDKNWKLETSTVCWKQSARRV